MDEDVPKGWLKAGSKPADYEVGVDDRVAHQRGRSGYIRSKKPKPRDFGTLMQAIKATGFKGKRVMLSGQVKAEGVTNWAGLWMRADSPQRPGEAFDNMQDRPIRGTSDWTEYSVVLDIPAQSNQLSFGVLLAGPGRVWIDDVKLRPVSKKIAITRPNRSAQQLRSKPANLGFEE